MLTSFIVIKKYPVGDKVFHFVIASSQLNMLNALEKTSERKFSSMHVVEESRVKWIATLPETPEVQFVVEMRDDFPKLPEGAPFSVKDLRYSGVEPKKKGPKQLTFL